MYDEIIDPTDEELAIDPSVKNLVIFEDILCIFTFNTT